MGDVILFLIGGLCFVIDAIMRFTSLGVDYVIDSLLLGYGMESFLSLNPKDTIIFVVNLLAGLWLLRLSFKKYKELKKPKEDEQPKEYKLSCSDCLQCYPDCPLNVYEGALTDEILAKAYYNYKPYRKPESNKKYAESYESEVHDPVNDYDYYNEYSNEEEQYGYQQNNLYYDEEDNYQYDKYYSKDDDDNLW